MRALLVTVILAFLLVGCATPQVTMPVGVASVAYAQARSDYGALRVIATQACQKGKLDKATCDQLAQVDTRMQVLRQSVEKSLLDPQTPPDWAAILQYTEAVMGMVVKMGLVP
jgi:hypothetical protein